MIQVESFNNLGSMLNLFTGPLQVFFYPRNLGQGDSMILAFHGTLQLVSRDIVRVKLGVTLKKFKITKNPGTAELRR